MKCLCGCFYVGKTKRQFFKLLKDHVFPIQKVIETAVSRHVGLHHSFDLHIIKFTALEHVPIHVRGGSVDQTLLQLEACWIHTLNYT